MQEDYKKILTYPSKIAKTKKGNIEYALYGEGPVLLFIHGGPGGYDQGLILGEFFRIHGYKILSVSRPGYLMTPLESGRTIEEQADLYALLMDYLEIEKTGVIHTSAGGPSGYTFTGKYSNRVMAQIAIDSVSMNYSPKISHIEKVIFLNKYGMWIMNFISNYFPKMALKELLKTESTLNKEEIERRADEIIKNHMNLQIFKALISSTGGTRYNERKKGVHNDLALFKMIDKIDMTGITCPTLIIHGDSDKDVSPPHAEYAQKAIKGSKIYWMPRGSHLSFFISEAGKSARDESINFFKDHIIHDNI
ncbi:MAG: alpha/beta hydrolase [Candidatus Eremiobacterota bacterium]